jgi:hypothetical protein
MRCLNRSRNCGVVFNHADILSYILRPYLLDDHRGTCQGTLTFHYPVPHAPEGFETMRPVLNFDEGTSAKCACAMQHTPHCGSSLRAISSVVETAGDVPQGSPRSDRQRGANVDRAPGRLGHGGFHDTQVLVVETRRLMGLYRK